jgi:hypothetical protein
VRLKIIALAALAATLAGCASNHPSSSGNGNPASFGPGNPDGPMTGSSASAQPVGPAAAFGTPRQVADDQDRPMTVTPVKAWWLPGNVQSRYNSQAASEGESPAENGMFLIIEMRVQAGSSAGADFPAPASGDGPMVISNHQEFSDYSSTTTNVVWNTCLPGILSTVTLEPGNWLLDGETYDVPAGPAVLTWQSGPGGAVADWQVPARSTGPLPASLAGALRSGNGC